MPSYVDGSNGIITTGNVSATGNVTGNYILGNGALLTGIVSSNVNLGNISQNVIPSQNVTYSLGNATNQWLDLWVSNNTIYLNSVPISLSSGNDLLVNNVPVVVSSNTAPPQTANIATTANVIAGNIVVSNATPGAGVVFADGTVQTTAAGASNYGDSNVESLLSSGTLTGNIETSGNIIGTYLYGDGSNITGLPAGYSNSDVQTYLASNANVVITTTGNITTTANISGNYILGNGSQLTGLPASYGNANVEAYLPSSNTIIAINSNVANLTTSLANTDANVANIASNVTTLQGQVYGNTNVSAYLGNANTTGNIYATNMNVANTVTATTFIGNFQGNISGNLVVPGSNTWVLYNNNGNAGADIGFRYNAGTQDIVVGNTVTANFFIGDGSQLTGLPAAYGNSNVEAYLPTSNTIIGINSNVSNTNSNVANLTTSLANTNSNVANNTANIVTLTATVANLATTTSLANTNSNVANTDANVANLTTSLANTNSNVANLTTSLSNTNSNVANLTIATGNNTNSITQLNISVNEGANSLANTNANVANTNSNVANLQSQVNALPVINTIPPVYLTAVANGNGQVFSNVILGSYTSNTSMTVFYNGALLENTFYELAGDVLTVNTYLNTGDNIDVITTLASNVNNVSSGYGNSNVALFFSDYAGNIIPATDNAYNLGEPGNTWAGVYANTFYGDGSQLTGITSNYGNANVADYLPTYTGNLTAGNATFIGTVTADGNTNGTAFAVVGNGAQSNVALGFFPTGNTPAQMAIRDYSTVTSTMYFDTSIGGSANGVFSFRTSNAFTTYATLGNTGLTVNSTQTSNTNVNSTIYYNTGTSQFTAGPSMAAFGAISAPFSGNITSAQMGHWIQASANIVLPQYTTVPAGTVLTITNSASGSTTPMKVTVFNQASDFIYYPPQYSTTNRFVELFFGQWAQFLSRGTGEWDVIASNVNAPQKVWAGVGQNVDIGMDTMNFRYTGTRFQFSPVAGSFTVFGQTLTQVSGSGPRSDAFASGTYSSGTWYDLTGVNITIAGSTAESLLTAVTGGWTRMYRATCMIDSTNLAYITVERLYNSTV